ncbi:MAG: dihydrofolate reductase [Thermoanaerobaculia bacterium]|nr:dihydrofolate reductase [Thermoanaerobaculia bacterium]
MRISVIAAVADNGIIGRDGDLPWHLPADLRRFKSLTMGHHLLVGRKTWESIGRPLPGRRILVLTRTLTDLPEGVRAVSSLERALTEAREAGETELFVAGGATVYEALLPRSDRLYLTRVETSIPGDVSFPSWDRSQWTLRSAERLPGDDSRPAPLRFETWERKSGP